MNNRVKKGLAGIFVLSLLPAGVHTLRRPAAVFYDIIVYGGGFGGCAAALAAEKKVQPRYFKDAEIALLQGILRERGAILEKK